MHVADRQPRLRQRGKVITFGPRRDTSYSSASMDSTRPIRVAGFRYSLTRMAEMEANSSVFTVPSLEDHSASAG